MFKLSDGIVELYRCAATSLPTDVESVLKKAYKREEKNSNAKNALSVIMKNVSLARKSHVPICQDTGIPIFFVRVPHGVSQVELKKQIIRATQVATKSVPLRPNAIDILTDRNSGDNTGIGFPIIYFEEISKKELIIDLMLKGSGSENVGGIYKLPAEEIKAERNLDGVRKCILEAVFKAQGKGCPPYIIGVGIGATKDQVTQLSKKQLLRKLDDINEHKVLSKLEAKVLNDLNKLGIGPLGFGGNTTALAVKIGVNHRHPASYFVGVSISCWAHRRSQLIWRIQSSKFTIHN